MKKRMASISVLAMFGLIGICLQIESRQHTQARATQQGFGHWEVNFGFVPGQKARITVANLSAGRTAEPLGFQCSVFDESGALVFETPRLEVPRGEFRPQDIDWENLAAVDSEPITLRKSVLVKVIVTGSTSSGSSSPEAVSSFEIIEVVTGKTTVSSYSFPILSGPMVGDFN
jgi:hypothetical protein